MYDSLKHLGRNFVRVENYVTPKVVLFLTPLNWLVQVYQLHKKYSTILNVLLGTVMSDKKLIIYYLTYYIYNRLKLSFQMKYYLFGTI